MNTILQRIKEAYHLETDAEVADFLEIKPSTLSMQKNRGRLNLKRIIEKCSDLNKNWLLEGTGPIRQTEFRDEIKHIPIYSSVAINNHSFDFEDSVKAGNLVADVNELYNFSPSNEMVGIIISSDSMAPILQKSDVAIFELNNSLSDGAVFLFSLDHKPVLRKVKKKSDAFLTTSNGKEQQAFDVQEIPKTQIIGKLVSVLRNL